MTVKRAMLTLVIAAGLLHGGIVSANADYPPSGAVVVFDGEMVTGGLVTATVHHCDVGEAVRTTLGSTLPVQAVCELVISGFAGDGDAAGRRAGVSRHELVLPAEPGKVAGEVELLGSDQTLTFFLDVRAPAPPAPVLASTTPGGMPGWPFLLLAGLIMVLMLFLVARRRSAYEAP